MKKLIALSILLLSAPVFAQTLSDTYITEIEQNIELLEELIAQGLGTDRDKFMLEYYKKKLTESKAAQTGGGNRVAFTTAIVNKEPANSLNEVDRAQRQLYFFTELRNLSGKRVYHRWVYRGEVVYEKGFNVGAARWRVWTQKTITPYQGPLTVEIVVDGNVLQSAIINVK
jgi:hypothetical protein